MARASKTLRELLTKYLRELEVNHYSQKTLTNRRKYIGYFLTWCDDQSLNLPRQVTPEVLQNYKAYLYEYKKTDSEPLKPGTQAIDTNDICYNIWV